MHARTDASNGAGRFAVWRPMRWVLTVGILAGWLTMLLVPGTLPWIFIVAAGVAGVVLVTSLLLHGEEPHRIRR